MRSISQLNAHRSGFTIIEVLVAVTISAIVLTIIYSSLFQIIKIKERVEETNELIHEVRVLFSRIEKDLANAYTRGQTGNTDTSNQIYFLGTVEGDNSRLAFTTLTRDTTYEDNQSDQTEITYYLRVSEDNQELYSLIRRDNPFPGNENGGFAYPISENIVRFQLFYTDENSFEVQSAGEPTKIREWNSAQIGFLPRAVEVNVTLRDDSNDERQFSSIFLIPAGNN